MRLAHPTWLTIPRRGLHTGIMILGAVGSGKTSACMYPYVDQLLAWRASSRDEKIGGLVLEVKGDFCIQVRRVLWIRNSKFDKSRLVPFGPRLESVLRTHLEQSRHAQQRSPAAPLFTFNGHRGVSPNSIRNAFRDHLIPRLGFVVPPGTRQPRVHDLRHSFAVGALLRWYRAGVDPAVRLPHLSTFLGHINPSATAVYLTITEELLDEANRRFSTFAPQTTTELMP